MVRATIIMQVEPLQNWMEGMLGIHDVAVYDNTFHGSKTDPVHTFGATSVRQANNTFLAGSSK